MRAGRKLSPNLLLVIIVLIGVAIAFCPAPPGVDAKAFPLLGVFIATIVGVLLQPYPMLIITLFGFFACMVCGLLSYSEGFACFGQGVIWLVVFTSIAAKAFVKTNLGHRLACFFVKKMGHSSLSLAYGLTLSEIILCAVIPSNTARASCITLPLTVSVSESLGSFPSAHTEGLIGRFLSLCAMHANQLSCAIFLTAVASNPMCQKFMADAGVHVSWWEWFKMAGIPGLICMLNMPWIMYKLSPPQIKTIQHAKDIAEMQLSAMSSMSKNEYITVFVFLGMLIGWVFGDVLHVQTAVVALGGLCALLMTNVLNADDITGAKDIWGICIWLSILNVITGKLADLGLIQHYSSILERRLCGLSWPLAWAAISVTYYMARYVVPGNVLHACAMFPSFFRMLIACGVPAKLGGMTLAVITAYCGFVTPYGSSSCPLYLNTGYIGQKLWWRIGVITTFAYFAIWIVFGGIWWKICGQ
ncbi:MAG: anion permease [Holosporales bacterium]|jgi:DASS family divalent anion:Na+ symporter|nr:anion permease [Holosporales bacterium]